jgi:hypothetical protein
VIGKPKGVPSTRTFPVTLTPYPTSTYEHKKKPPAPCNSARACYNTRMKKMKTLPQGTPRIDNPRILEWFGPQGKVLQLIKLPTSHHYRILYPGGASLPCYYSTKRYSLSTMLDLLNR